MFVFFFALFQIRVEPKSCLTLHHVFGSQGAKRTATLNIQRCVDRAHSPTAAVSQVGTRPEWVHVQKEKKNVFPIDRCMTIFAASSTMESFE